LGVGADTPATSNASQPEAQIIFDEFGAAVAHSARGSFSTAFSRRAAAQTAKPSAEADGFAFVPRCRFLRRHSVVEPAVQRQLSPSSSPFRSTKRGTPCPTTHEFGRATAFLGPRGRFHVDKEGPRRPCRGPAAPLRPLQFGRTAVVSDARLTPPPLEGKSVTRFEFSPFCTFPHGGHVFFASARFPPLTAPTRPTKLHLREQLRRDRR